MPTSTLIFTIIGVSYTTAQLMRFLEWLDAPKKKKAPHPGKPVKANRV